MVRVLVALIIVLLIVSCSSGTHYAPIENRTKIPFSYNKFHIVSSGETLYSIAWRYGMDVRGLAITNSIDASYVIFPGQKLLLNDSKKVTVGSRKSTTTAKKPALKPSSKLYKSSVTATRKPVRQSVQVLASKGFPFRWQWPARGSVSNAFRASGPSHKGISFQGPYDGIISTAAPQQVPEELLAQLAEGGRLVIPVGDDKSQDLMLIEKTEQGVIESVIEPAFFVPFKSGVIR